MSKEVENLLKDDKSQAKPEQNPETNKTEEALTPKAKESLKAKSKWGVISVLSLLGKIFLVFLVVSFIREEFFPRTHPSFATPFYSDKAKMRISVDLYKRSKLVSNIGKWRDVPYNSESIFPIETGFELTEEIKEKIGEYNVKVVAKMKEKGVQSVKIEGQSGLVEMREMEVTRIRKEGDTPKRREETGAGTKFRYIRTALFFQFGLDFERRYVRDEMLDYKIYEGKVYNLSKPGESGYTQRYAPALRESQWWVMPRDLLEEEDLFKKFTETESLERKDKSHPQNERVSIRLDLSSFRKMKWVLKMEMAEAESPFPELNAVYDHIKEIMSDNSAGYLTLLLVVYIFHTLFLFLSIRENYMFYSQLKRNAGLSFRKAVMDLVFEVICLVYYLEYKASFLILIQSVMELCFYSMVVLKMSPLRFDLSSPFPYISIDRTPLKGMDLETDRHDRYIVGKIFRYMCPVLGLYLGYSLYFYTREESLYLFIIEKVVAFIFVFGFANMFPQVYINYRFKSVEYLPWKALVYKFFNTIIDDLFAFATKIPWLKRLAVFRDDVIFVIFLVQMYLYRGNTQRGKDEFEKMQKEIAEMGKDEVKGEIPEKENQTEVSTKKKVKQE